MCGIAGAFGEPGVCEETWLVERVVDSQRARGPDHQAVAAFGGPGCMAVLGHNRLSIIDLSVEASQPMEDGEGQRAIVYNGEIYNYIELRRELEGLGRRFRTQSDTEVILQAFGQWGERAVERFNGMFAFALFERVSGRLVLFRDRFGVKPLYWLERGGRLYFASTCEVLARHFCLPPDLAYLSRGLQFGVYDDAECAPYHGIRALRPGHCLAAWAVAGRLTWAVRQWYSLEGAVGTRIEGLASTTERAVVAEVESLVSDAVRLRLRSDVPVGISLSGGVDSTTVAAFAAEGGRERSLVGFTLGHPDDRMSEGRQARSLARQLGMHVEYVSPSTEEVVSALPATLRAQGAPFPTLSIVGQYLVYERARRSGVIVLLGGQGGDEAFMGYPKFHLYAVRELLHARKLPEAFMRAAGLIGAAMGQIRKIPLYWRLRHRQTRERGLGTLLRLPPASSADLGYSPVEPLWLRQARDVTSSSLPTLLRYEDRNSMGNSIESRLPFMDYRIVEYGLAIPTAFKLRGGRGKWALREVARGRIPERIRTSRYKRGFDASQQNAWIDGGLGRFVREQLRGYEALVRPWLWEGADIDRDFSDDALKNRFLSFNEAMTLLWLAAA